jgi:hypothetical protein
MKRTLICLVSVLVFFAGTVFAQVADPCHVYDPADMENVVVLDYHPDYGYVGKYDMPMEPGGFDPANVDLEALFPGEKVISYEVREDVFTGTALVQHRALDGTVFFAWHRYENERVAWVEVIVERQVGHVTVHIKIGRLNIWICSNGAWAVWWD